VGCRPVADLPPTGIGIARQFRTINYRKLDNDELQREYEMVRARVLSRESYPERDADEQYLRELEREVLTAVSQSLCLSVARR
jgi:hypothetical protein